MSNKVTIYIIKVGKLVYVGSTWNSAECFINHMNLYKNENIDTKLYNEIRNADLEWKDLELKIITKRFIKKHCELERRKIQQIYINKYDSVRNGLNDRNAYVSPEELKRQLSINQKKYNNKNKEKLKKKQKIYNEKARLKNEIKNIFKIWDNYDNIIKN